LEAKKSGFDRKTVGNLENLEFICHGRSFRSMFTGLKPSGRWKKASATICHGVALVADGIFYLPQHCDQCLQGSKGVVWQMDSTFHEFEIKKYQKQHQNMLSLNVYRLQTTF
jgi:hypothetical protein